MQQNKNYNEFSHNGCWSQFSFQFTSLKLVRINKTSDLAILVGLFLLLVPSASEKQLIYFQVLEEGQTWHHCHL